MSKEFEISKLLEITKNNKYEACVAAFEVIGNLERLDIPKKYLTRKHAVQAMVALSDGLIKYDYIDEETRLKLEEELQGQSKARAQSALDAVFASPTGAPLVDDSEEDLDEIGEAAPTEAMPDDGDEFGDDDDSDTTPRADIDDDDDDDDDDEAEDTVDDDDDEPEA